MAKSKIAILGGGVASLAAAYELTRTAALRAQHDVTVYQMGWRLGGKGASGRNPDAGERIEEHGLHVWFGFYENAFALIRDCYGERVAAADNPLKTWRDAFKPQSFTPIGDEQDGKLTYWGVRWPTNTDVPGDGKVLLSPWGAITQMLGMLEFAFSGWVTKRPPSTRTHVIPPGIAALLTRAVPAAATFVAGATGEAVVGIEQLFSHAVRWAEAFGGAHDAFERTHHEGIRWLLNEFKSRLLTEIQDSLNDDPSLRHVWHVLDVGLAIVSGVLNPTYGILDDLDLNRIDDYEFRAWLIANGASPHVANDSHEVRALYDTCFAYEKGDLGKPNYAAGAAVRVILRIVATYKEAVMFLMQAGMGEAVIAPLYEVLLARGVRFEFFHKVRRLELSDDRALVQKIRLGVQAKTVAGEYRPLFDVKGLPCWPSHPFWEQLTDGARMKAASVEFESNWCDWPDADTRTLQLGVDFDRVVLGISLGAFKKLNAEATMCDELIAASASFRDTTQQLGLVPTQSVQLWVNRSLADLGWTDLKPAFVAGPESLDIWADMSQELRLEGWPIARAPLGVHYFCGVYETLLFEAPTTDRTVPKRALAGVYSNTLDWFGKYAASIWPKAANAQSGALDWDVLFAPGGEQGVARLAAQYLRANVDPTECCVTSLAGTTRYRLRADESGFVNLTLAGDWTRTGLNAACVEGAVMSGMAAARAISGAPIDIVGEDFFQPGNRPGR